MEGAGKKTSPTGHPIRPRNPNPQPAAGTLEKLTQETIVRLICDDFMIQTDAILKLRDKYYSSPKEVHLFGIVKDLILLLNFIHYRSHGVWPPVPTEEEEEGSREEQHPAGELEKLVRSTMMMAWISDLQITTECLDDLKNAPRVKEEHKVHRICENIVTLLIELRVKVDRTTAAAQRNNEGRKRPGPLGSIPEPQNKIQKP